MLSRKLQPLTLLQKDAHNMSIYKTPYSINVIHCTLTVNAVDDHGLWQYLTFMCVRLKHENK